MEWRGERKSCFFLMGDNVDYFFKWEEIKNCLPTMVIPIFD